jgi:hypothetical protein
MANVMTKAVLGVTLAATALTAAAPADAQRWRRNRGGGDVAAGAVLGGIVGLGIGAAIASSNRDRFYDRRFRGGGYYDRGFGYNRFNGYNDGYVYDRRFERRRARQARRAYRNGYRDGFYGQPRGYYGAPRGYYGAARGYYGY